MQAAVIGSINMAVLAVIVVDVDNNIGSAGVIVTARTLGYPYLQEPRGMGIPRHRRMVFEARIMGWMTGQTIALKTNDMIGCCTVYVGGIVAILSVAGMQGTIGAARSRVGMAVLTITLMNDADDIAAVTAGTLGCTVAGDV